MCVVCNHVPGLPSLPRTLSPSINPPLSSRDYDNATNDIEESQGGWFYVATNTLKYLSASI